MAATDRILPATRALAVLLGSVVLGAFVVLYFFPTETARLFAWPIKPPMTAMFIGASYANGVVFFATVLTERRWHRVWAPHVGVFLFATLLMIATLLHWDRFTHGHPVFWAWVFVYAVAPVLTPWVVLRNRREDPRTFEARDAEVPRALRLVWMLPGSLFFLAALEAFLFPGWLIERWPWVATPLTMRVMVSFYSMLGVAVFTVLREPRWSAWRTGAIGVAVWHGLVVLAALLRQQDFRQPLFTGWWFWCELALFAGALATIAAMELRVRSRPARVA